MLDEVLALQRQQLGERGSRSLVASSARISALDQRAALAEEHVLGAAQADALRAEAAGAGGVLGGVGVGPHAQPARARRRSVMIRCDGLRPGRPVVVGEPASQPALEVLARPGTATTGTSPR